MAAGELGAGIRYEIHRLWECKEPGRLEEKLVGGGNIRRVGLGFLEFQVFRATSDETLETQLEMRAVTQAMGQPADRFGRLLYGRGI